MPFSKMPIWDEKHLRAATYAAGVTLWSWNVETDAITLDEGAYDLWGVSKDQEKVTFEILSENDIRWISARGQGDDADIADGVMFGIFLDVTQRKQAEEANELLAGEM